MLFNSIAFLIFFPIVLVLYFSVPFKYRVGLLLVASYFFYMYWKVEYGLLIVASTVIDFTLSKGLQNESNEARRKLYLMTSLFTNLGLLAYFKYTNFFLDSINQASQYAGGEAIFSSLEIILPVGISFYTFQTLGYTIDVYRKKTTAETDFFRFALYVSFFPQLVAGPIERSQNLLPQFKKTISFDYDRMTDGLKLMIWGFFKKVVIADRLAIYVNTVYAQPDEFNGLVLLVATYFFAFQIYCDFSGYSDIAIGAAKILGFNLMDNFNRPYFSKSISEFWGRWHISLSTWFRDYLYIPLGGNRVPVRRYYANLLIVFLVSGLWHGANWTFVVWGAIHGTYLILEILLKKMLSNIRDPKSILLIVLRHKVVRILITFHLVLVSWVFFRAESIEQALYIISNFFQPIDFLNPHLTSNIVSRFEFVLSIIFIGVLLIIHLIERHQKMRYFLNDYPLWVRHSVYIFLIISILFFGVFNYNEFIYFQF